MNKKEIIKIIIGVGVLTLLIILGVSFSKTKEVPKIESEGGQQEQQSQLKIEDKKPAQKIEVVHFHATQQCISCITVGEFALKTIKERFPEEYANGTIIFKDINGELPENRDIVIKYQAAGSSLFVNAIIEGKDNIKENITVWYKISNEQDFMNYFENELKNLLGKA